MNTNSEIKISSIIVENRLRKDLGDIESLSKDISANGLITPITVYETGQDKYKLLAGERRLEAAKRLGHDSIKANILNNINPEQALKIEIKENIERKTFNKEERILCGLELEKTEKEEAKKRQIVGIKTNLRENFPTGRTDDIIAEFLHIGSGKQYKKEKFIVENKNFLSCEDFEDWKNDKLSTNKAYSKIKNAQNTDIDDVDSAHNSEKDFISWQTSFNKIHTRIIDNIEQAAKNIGDLDIRDIEGFDEGENIIKELNQYKRQAEHICKVINSLQYNKDKNYIIKQNK